jgi:hypothetical protein
MPESLDHVNSCSSSNSIVKIRSLPSLFWQNRNGRLLLKLQLIQLFPMALCAFGKGYIAVVAAEAPLALGVVGHGDERLFPGREQGWVAVCTEQSSAGMGPAVKDDFPLACAAIGDELVGVSSQGGSCMT